MIRHKATGEYMPQLRNKGYSHWNPSHPEVKLVGTRTGCPRFLKDEKQAKKCIDMWFTFQNGYNSYYQIHSEEFDDIVDFKKDDRKKEDLEIVKVEVWY